MSILELSDRARASFDALLATTIMNITVGSREQLNNIVSFEPPHRESDRHGQIFQNPLETLLESHIRAAI